MITKTFGYLCSHTDHEQASKSEYLEEVSSNNEFFFPCSWEFHSLLFSSVLGSGTFGVGTVHGVIL